MFKLIPAKEHHLEKLTPLMMTTGYWAADLKNNSFGLSEYEFMREFFISPLLEFTTIAVDAKNNDEIIGAITACSKQELYQAMTKDKRPDFHPKISKLFKDVIDFEINDSYHISFLAVEKKYRGLGIGMALLKHAEECAKNLNIKTLSLYTVSCQVSSICLYLKFGMMLQKVITASEKIPFPYFLYFEKNSEIEAKRDYFETAEYKNLNLFGDKTHV